MQQKNAGNANFFCSFNLPNKTYFSGLCKGNGITLGLTNGDSYNGGLWSYYNGNAYSLSIQSNSYGVPIGTTTTNTHLPLGQSTFGITRDASKSGIICEADANIVLVIKY